MAYIEPEAMRKLTASLREKGREDLAQATRRQLIARQKRQVALQFDIRQAMAAGDLEGAQKLQQSAYRADALDRGELAGVRAAQDFDVREAEGAERRRAEKNDRFRPLGGVTTRAGPVTAENTIVLPATAIRDMGWPSEEAGLQEAQRRMSTSGRGYLTREDFGNLSGGHAGRIADESKLAYLKANVDPLAQQKIAFAEQDREMRKKPLLSPEILANRKAGAEWAARTARSDLAKDLTARAPAADVLAARKAAAELTATTAQGDLTKALGAVARDEYWRPDVNQTLSRGGTIRMNGRMYSAQQGRNKEIPFVPPPRRKRPMAAAPY